MSFRLPIQHPDYQYLSSKNPYGVLPPSLKGIAFSDQETETHSGNWRSQFLDGLFSPDRELHVEIGCNAGHVLLELAHSQKNIAFIGIDWKFKPIFRAAEKAHRRHLKNLIFLRAHAERLSYMFKPKEIDSLSLFFPDPWSKKKQRKNRFLTLENLKMISQLLKPMGIFHIKTDHQEYFDWILSHVEKSLDSWKILEISRNLHKDCPAPHLLQIPKVTLFEKLFIQNQIPIQSLKLQALRAHIEN